MLSRQQLLGSSCISLTTDRRGQIALFDPIADLLAISSILACLRRRVSGLPDCTRRRPPAAKRVVAPHHGIQVLPAPFHCRISPQVILGPVRIRSPAAQKAIP